MRLALDIGGTSVKCAAVSDEGEIERSGEFSTDPLLDTLKFGRYLVDGTKNVTSGWGMDFDMVGAGMAGFTDGMRGIVYESPNIPNVKNLELGRILKEGLSMPAFVDNDATAAAWGEFLFGGHAGVRDMLVVTLGTGIGGGLVLDGRLYRGARGMAGEIGQMAYTPDGPKCRGGSLGCLELYVGKAGLMEDYQKRAGLTEPVEPKIIHERARDGESAAIDAWGEYGHRLGVIFASCANLLDLGAIILTGGIIGAWDQFEKPMAESFREHCITPHKETLRVTLTSLEGNAGTLGAAFLDRAI